MGFDAELGVGDARFLEVDHVEELVGEDLPHELPPAGGMGPRGSSGTLIAITPCIRSGWSRAIWPSDHRAPVVAAEDRLLDAEVVEQAEQVAGEVVDVVVLDRLGSIGLAIAPLVGGEHALVAGVGERRDLVAPGVGELGEAVGEHDDGAVLPARRSTRWSSMPFVFTRRYAGWRGAGWVRSWCSWWRDGQAAEVVGEHARGARVDRDLRCQRDGNCRVGIRT